MKRAASAALFAFWVQAVQARIYGNRFSTWWETQRRGLGATMTSRLGIRSIVFLTLAIMLTVAGLIAAIILVRATGTEAEVQLLEQHRMRARLVARHLESVPVAVWSETLQTVSGGASDRLAVLGSDLRVRAGTPLPSLSRDLVVLQVRDGQRSASRTMAGDDPGHIIALKLRPQDESFAILVGYFSLRDARTAMGARQQTVLVYLAINLVLLLILGIYLSGRLLVRPLEHFSETAERMDVQNVDPSDFIATYGPAEIHRLAQAFGDLIARLTLRNDQLAESLAELEETRDTLIRSEKLATVGRLAAGVAHEIGNPLASVVGFLDYLRKDDEITPELRRDLTARMVREVDRIQQTLRQLLDFSRPGTDRPELVRLEDVVENTIKLVSYHRKMADITVSAEGETAPVYLDPQRMSQVFANLVLNAADAIDGSGLVRIRFMRQEGNSVVRIHDSGPGIPEAELPHIFDPFWSTKPAGAGTGLGLSLSQRIVENAGGTLEARNHADGGAMFTLSFPLATRASKAPRPSQT